MMFVALQIGPPRAQDLLTQERPCWWLDVSFTGPLFDSVAQGKVLIAA